MIVVDTNVISEALRPKPDGRVLDWMRSEPIAALFTTTITEAELLYGGNQYRRAIERYYVSGPRQFPRALEDLLKDPRKPGTERYLRKLYIDPLSFQYLDGTEIDYVEGLHGSGFKFQNPNVKSTCGCGSSFSA